MVIETTPGNVRPIRNEDEMRASYLDYAMSVIVSRALPDVRDGLKPVQRGLRPPPPPLATTGAPLAAIAEEMRADIEKETVDFVPNYDDSRREPTVLPSR